jgi:hypothetical protein
VLNDTGGPIAIKPRASLRAARGRGDAVGNCVAEDLLLVSVGSAWASASLLANADAVWIAGIGRSVPTGNIGGLDKPDYQI